MTAVTPLDNDIYEAFATLQCALSPENLSCDGQATREEVRARATDVLAQWHALEDAVGREVKNVEVYEWYAYAGE